MEQSYRLDEHTRRGADQAHATCLGAEGAVGAEQRGRGRRDGFCCELSWSLHIGVAILIIIHGRQGGTTKTGMKGPSPSLLKIQWASSCLFFPWSTRME